MRAEGDILRDGGLRYFAPLLAGFMRMLRALPPCCFLCLFADYRHARALFIVARFARYAVCAAARVPYCHRRVTPDEPVRQHAICFFHARKRFAEAGEMFRHASAMRAESAPRRAVTSLQARQ